MNMQSYNYVHSVASLTLKLKGLVLVQQQEIIALSDTLPPEPCTQNKALDLNLSGND